MAPFYGDTVLCSLFICFIIVYLLSGVTVGVLRYSREDLLHTRDHFHHAAKPEFSKQTIAMLAEATTATDSNHRHSNGMPVRQRKRGKRAGALVRFRRRFTRPPLPSILLSNVRSLKNKAEELRALVDTQRDYKECSALCFTETWLYPSVPDSSITPPGFQTFRTDRDCDITGKSVGGGVCVMVNERWCTDTDIVSSFCSTDLELLIVRCQPFYSPREFSSILLVVAYIHPEANAENAMNQLASHISNVENKHPDGLTIALGDFNHTSLKSTLPKFHQHVSCPTRKDKTLDHCYTTIPGAYHSIPRAPLGRSDHSMVLLLPTYRQQLKTVKPVKKSICKWDDQSVAALQGCLECTDWSVFKETATDIDEYTDSVTSYISFCEQLCIPTKTVTIYGNNKPWFKTSIKNKLVAKDKAYYALGQLKQEETDKEVIDKARRHFNQTKYEVEKEIRQAKIEYREKIEKQFSSNDSSAVWKGLQNITQYKQKQKIKSDDPTLPDKLNNFYARFDRLNTTSRPQVDSNPSDPAFVVEEPTVRKLFKRHSIKKASGPDGISSPCLKHCADQLAPVFTDVFNVSLHECKVPSCFKSAIIVPVPKKSKTVTLNDYRPVALTSIVMKVFERLVLCYLKSVTDSLMDPLQFAYRANRSVDDAVSLGLHFVLQHLEKANTYARVLFIDFSSAFNTIVPSQLIQKLLSLNVNINVCKWIADFLTNRPQVVRVNGIVSDKIILNTGAPQGCVLSPLLFTLFTNDFRSDDPCVAVIKFSDDTTMEGLITGGDETGYRDEVEKMVDWCASNNLELNVSKTKEMIIDFRKKKTPLLPLSVEGQEVEQVESFKFLGVHISNTLSWEVNITSSCKKAQQRLYFLRQLKKFKISTVVMTQFYRSVIESILSFSISVWYGSATAKEKRKLHHVTKTASKIIGHKLPALDTIYSMRIKRRAKSIISDRAHPANHLFQTLPSGKRLCSLKCKSNRLKNSFYPSAIRATNRE